jgi:hypothetical protein
MSRACEMIAEFQFTAKQLQQQLRLIDKDLITYSSLFEGGSDALTQIRKRVTEVAEALLERGERELQRGPPTCPADFMEDTVRERCVDRGTVHVVYI